MTNKRQEASYVELIVQLVHLTMRFEDVGLIRAAELGWDLINTLERMEMSELTTKTRATAKP